MTRRTLRAPSLSLDDWRMLARLEGEPLPRGQALGDSLGMSASAAWALIRRARRAGVLGLTASVKLQSDVCQCITYVRVSAVKLELLDALEHRIAADPAVMVAARVTGPFDYRLFSRHLDHRVANDWSRCLETLPGVVRVLTRICDRVTERPRLAAVILGSD